MRFYQSYTRKRSLVEEWGCGLVLENTDATNRVDHRCEGET